MRLWLLLTLAAALCGYLTWGPCLARAASHSVAAVTAAAGARQLAEKRATAEARPVIVSQGVGSTAITLESHMLPSVRFSQLEDPLTTDGRGHIILAQAAPAPVTVSGDGTVSGVPVVDPVKAPAWLVDTVRAARDLARAGQWGPFVALILTALTTIFSLALKIFPALWTRLRPHMGYVVIGLTLAMFLSGNLAAIEVGAGGVAWGSAIGRAVLAGMAACGGWELILKPLLRRLAPKLAAALGAPVEPPKP